jgi:hypothetical protein
MTKNLQDRERMIPVHVNFPRDLIEKGQRLGEAEGNTFSALVRRTLAELIARRER